MGLTCLDGNAPTLTNVTLESPGEETGHAESPAGAQWWTHSFGDAPKTATAQRFRATCFHTNTHSLARMIEATKPCQEHFMQQTHFNSVGRCVDLDSTDSCQAARAADSIFFDVEVNSLMAHDVVRGIIHMFRRRHLVVVVVVYVGFLVCQPNCVLNSLLVKWTPKFVNCEHKNMKRT